MRIPSPTPKLSILIPSVPNRITTKMLSLFNKLEKQIEKLANPDDVEILVLLDNKRRSIGLKRDSLLSIARGNYVAFSDDDDLVEDYYIEKAIQAIDNSNDVDVITFKERVYVNDYGPGVITFELGHPTNDFWAAANAKRPPWHQCFWKRTLAQKFHYNDSMYGEDWYWAAQANAAATTSYHIDDIMRTYTYNDAVTEAIL